MPASRPASIGRSAKVFKFACRLRKVSPVFVLRLSYSLIFYMTRTAAISCQSVIATLSPRMIRGIKFLFVDSVLVTAVRALGKKHIKTHTGPMLNGAGLTPGKYWPFGKGFSSLHAGCASESCLCS